MASCPKLEYESNKYICTVTGMRMDSDDPKVKHVCKPDYGEEYKKCHIYKDS